MDEDRSDQRERGPKSVGEGVEIPVATIAARSSRLERPNTARDRIQIGPEPFTRPLPHILL